MPLTAEVLEQIKRSLGPKGWTSPDEGESFLSDILGPGLRPLLIARPESTEQVSEIVRLCAHARIAIIPQGGNSNLCRMAVQTEPGAAILLSLARMNRMLDINREAATLTVEAGCFLQEAQDVAREAGFVLSPDWGARGTATVGGAVATNGGGLNVVRYGTTREQVLGMEVVIADGTVWNGLRSLIKDNSGYDLKHLFIGSEGTLGVITKLVFRLHQAEPETRSMMASLADLGELMSFFAMARDIGGTGLSAFELMPSLGVEKALARYPDLKRPFETPANWYVLVRFSGRDEIEDLLGELFEAGFAAGILADAVLATSVAQERNLWEIREHMIPHQYFPEHRMLKWDVSVPIDRISQFLGTSEAAVRDLAQDAITYAVGHVGDGNVHFSAFLPKCDADDSLCSAIYDRVDALIWELGGSIVAEHGVGALFRQRMVRQKSAVEYKILQCIKMSLDPYSIMNPGKLVITDADGGDM